MSLPASLEAIGEGAAFTVYDLPDAPQIRGAFKVGDYVAITKDMLFAEEVREWLRSNQIPDLGTHYGPAVPRYHERVSCEDSKCKQHPCSPGRHPEPGASLVFSLLMPCRR